jgi:hypothetical protein
MLTLADFDPVVAAVPAFQAKWILWREHGELYEPIFVEFSFRMAQHLVEHAADDNFDDFTLLFAALEAPLSNPTTELYDSLTMGFLEDLIHECKQRGINLDRVASCATGSVIQREWQRAFNYTQFCSGPLDQ